MFLCVTALAVLESTFVDQVGLKRQGDPPTSASQCAGIKVITQLNLGNSDKGKHFIGADLQFQRFSLLSRGGEHGIRQADMLLGR